MIPKLIHYCWFGKGKMPLIAEKCIASWKKYVPDYELIQWDESNFDLTANPYVKEAYEAKKFAFVTDYVRLYVLYTYGGIYMDTDVQLLKSIDDLLAFPAFTGFESEKDVPTGIMASVKDGLWVKEQLDYYDNRHFLKQDGSMDMTTNTQIISKIMCDNGFVLKNSYQVYKDELHVFPKDYFSPKERSGIINLSENSYCIHHFNGSWMTKNQKMKKFFFKKIIGPKITAFLIKAKKTILKKVKQ